MTDEEKQALQNNITDMIRSLDMWRQEDVERGRVRGHLQCTKKELEFLLGLISNKGHWIPVYGKNGKTIMSYKCSKCDFHPKHAIITDFCGGCGADMRGE